MEHDDSPFLQHEPCAGPDCTSSDGFARYEDGHGHCFVCGYHEHSGAEPATRSRRMPKELWTDAEFDGEIRALKARGINEETCKKFGYKCGRRSGKPVQVATYYDADGQSLAQKVRFKNKDFLMLGDGKDAPLYGQWLWRDSGKMVIVTEGEIDALTVSQLQGNKWPVVSLPNGAQGAKRSIRKQLEWLERFDSVILMFDMDEPGQKAAKECALLFTPGKAKIAHLPLKDPNEMLLARRGSEVIDAIWGAKVYRPDGIVSGSDTWEEVIHEENVVTLPYPWESTNEKTHGLRLGEIVTLTAGSGIGKSTICREIEHHLIRLGETVGIVALEESIKRSTLGLMSIELNKPLHLDREGVAEEQLHEAWEATVGNGRVFLYDHWGSLASDNLLSKIRFMARGCGCRWIILDHISIVVSGLGDGDERRLIDNLMTDLRSLVEETGIGLILVSHLKRPEGKGHEEGAKTSLSQLRGSAAIGQLSDLVIGVERDQQGDDPNVLAVRVLKNRFSGDTGITGHLSYDKLTGRLNECFMSEEGELLDDEETF